MTLTDITIMALLLVGIVGILVILVLVLQYDKDRMQRLMEDVYLSKMECDYSLQQLDERESKRATDQQVEEARERMVKDEFPGMLQESEKQIIAECEKRLIERGIMVDPAITYEKFKQRQEAAASHQKAFEDKIFEMRKGAEFKPVDNVGLII